MRALTLWLVTGLRATLKSTQYLSGKIPRSLLRGMLQLGSSAWYCSSNLRSGMMQLVWIYRPDKRENGSEFLQPQEKE